MLLKIVNINALQVFSIAEFDFCYNYVFYQPFQQKMQLVLDEPFTFDDGQYRDLCTRTDNVLFRQVNISTFSARIDCEFDLNKQPFSLFYFIWKYLKVINLQVNVNLSNTAGADFAFLVATVSEQNIEIIDSSFNFTSNDAISSFYGIANNLSMSLTINRSSFTYNCMSQITNFYGIAGQIKDALIFFSNFSFSTVANINSGISYLNLGTVIINNVIMSGSLSGTNSYGIFYESRGYCFLQYITYSLITTGTIQSCGFIQLSSGSVSVQNLVFSGFANLNQINLKSSYYGTCASGCITDASLTNGLCYCPSNSIISGNICSCSLTGSKMVSSQCTCPPRATISGSACVCTTGAILSGTNCQCTTNYNQIYTALGNSWCKNVNMCCTKTNKTGTQNYGCSDGTFQMCTTSAYVV
ncbi:Hypothetical_protein [Hexamita inflata]|uniref:Hypothetical_protein n=1 Tax=Hexamita inflata TaxID=28002 RepID=A0AA86P721_9EUKA|nr:Hypothetical protein HINF_LOCUS19571 [Hexamita inflata]